MKCEDALHVNNNAKRSIPAHLTFVNDTHHDLHLWTVTSKSIGITLVNMSAKFDKEIHNSLVSIMFTSLFPYMSIVTLTFDLWPQKQQGPSLIMINIFAWNLMKKYTTV